MTDVFHQSASFFDDPNAADRSILPLQIGSVADPTLPTMEQTSGLLSPDHATGSRLAHFDADLYDLRPQSHLVRLLRVLLGDSGSGQLRKRYTVSRIQTTLEGTHFYDLDGFYGSLFGAVRRQGETLGNDPMTSVEAPDDWDEIMSRDAQYRERISALAQALPMAGTVEGLRQAAEALTGVECDVYETWRLLEGGRSAINGRTWDQVQALASDWDHLEDVGTWRDVVGAVTVGRSGVNNPDEVIVRPRRDYQSETVSVGPREAERLRQEDEMSLHRVLNRIKPAGVLLTIDPYPVAPYSRVPVASVTSDSDYWEVLRKVIPRPGLGHVSDPYAGLGSSLVPLPQVPFSNAQTHGWSYNSLVISAAGYSISAEDGADVLPEGAVVDDENWERVPDQNGRITAEYRPAQGVSDQRTLLAAQAAADSILQAHPYSGPRVKVPTSG